MDVRSWTSRETLGTGAGPGRRFLFVALTVVALALPSRAVAADWPQFHFDVAHTGVNPSESILNSANVSGLTEGWAASLGPGSESSPAVVNGVVFVGSDDGGVYVIDAVSGALRWRATTGGAIGLSSPAVARGRVFVGSTDQQVHAFDAATGAQFWATSTGTTVEAPPTVANGVVYAASDKLYALDATTGAVIWTAETGGPVVFSAPTVVGGKVYVGAFNTSNLFGMLEAFDAATGASLWTATTFGAIEGAPVVVGGSIFVGATSFGVEAFDAATGAQLWSNITTGEAITTPAVLNGQVYLGDQAGNMYALNAATGAVIWKTNIRTRAEGFEFSSPALANGVLYIGGTDAIGTGGEVWAFNAATGAVLFSSLVPGVVRSSPAVVDGRVYFSSDKLHMFVGPKADLSITKSGAPNPVVSGNRLTYTLTVTNDGPQNASGVTATDPLPDTLRFNSVSSTQGTCTRSITRPKPRNGTVTCSLGNLANGASASITINVTATTPGTLTNTASVSGNESDPNALNNSATATVTVVGT